jgi:hypothetical protein
VTAALALAQQLPLALLFVLTLGAFLIALLAVILWRQHFGLAALPAGERQQPHWTDDKYHEEWDYHSNEKTVRRDTPLGEALAFIAYRRWGQEYAQTVVDMFEKGGKNVLSDFQQKAYDKELTVWGKLNGHGVYRSVPPEHWSDHYVDPGALLNGYARSWGHDTTSYSYLMVSRAEIEWEWPNEG